jgi:GINS complex subunit 3
MDKDYFSIDSILAEGQKIQCSFKLDVSQLGYLGGGDDVDIKEDTKMQLPFWLAETLFYQDWVDLALPQPFTQRVKKALNAEARSVKLSLLVGETGHWYAFGKMIARVYEQHMDVELCELLLKTFQARLVDIMDQAQHTPGNTITAGLASAGGATGAEDFRDGLEWLERELFVIAQESAKQIKIWHESSDKR